MEEIKLLRECLNRFRLHMDRNLINRIESVIYPEIKSTFVSPELIIQRVSEKIGITIDEMKQKSRKGKIIIARHMAMHMIRDITGYPLRVVGEYFNRDHATASNAITSVDNRLATDRYFRDTYNHIKSKL
jgi:chromosomal replication initiation ATPase DnaA